MSHHNFRGTKPSLTVEQLMAVLAKMPPNCSVVFEWEGQFICIDATDGELSVKQYEVVINVEGYN